MISGGRARLSPPPVKPQLVSYWSLVSSIKTIEHSWVRKKAARVMGCVMEKLGAWILVDCCTSKSSSWLITYNDNANNQSITFCNWCRSGSGNWIQADGLHFSKLQDEHFLYFLVLAEVWLLWLVFNDFYVVIVDLCRQNEANCILLLIA